MKNEKITIEKDNDNNIIVTRHYTKRVLKKPFRFIVDNFGYIFFYLALIIGEIIILWGC